MADYEKMTVAILRGILKERGIASTGLTRKAQIIEKLQEVDAEEQAARAEAPAVEAEKSSAVQEPEPEPEPEREPEPEPEEEPTPMEDVLPKPPSPPLEKPEAAPIVEANDAPAKPQNQALPTTETESEVAPFPTTAQPSATNTAASSQLNSDVESSRKRRRRSASPSLEMQDLSKKAKTLQAHVHLKEDEGSKGDSEQKGEVISEQPTTFEQNENDPPKVVAPVSEEITESESLDKIESKPSIHPPTRALYIRNFIRPLQPTALRRHLASLASQNSNQDPIELLHLDSIRTHAFVILDTVTSAQKIRNSIHESVWPDEQNRKPLWADFVPVENVQGWVDTENGAGKGLMRWEIQYSGQGDDTTAELREEGVPSKKKVEPQKEPRDKAVPVRNEKLELERQQPVQPPGEGTTSFATLDSLFKNTHAKPMLYFKPVSESLATTRLEELREATSKRWPPTHRDRELAPPRGPGGREEEEILHRYTFEDGDKLVDGGMHRFGKRARENERVRIGGPGSVPTGPRSGGRPGGRRAGGGGFGRRWR